jgi:hypothetical protein
MRHVRRASRWLATVLLCLAGLTAQAATTLHVDVDPEWRNAGSLADLVEVLETWLDAHAPWPRRSGDPVIRTISPEELASLSGVSSRGHGTTRGLYDPEMQTVFLREPWDRFDAQDVSVLLHELVHHRQASSHWYCPGAQELPAYRLQAAWLAERGLEANVNWIAVVLESGCTRRDIHPD